MLLSKKLRKNQKLKKYSNHNIDLAVVSALAEAAAFIAFAHRLW